MIPSEPKRGNCITKGREYMKTIFCRLNWFSERGKSSNPDYNPDYSTPTTLWDLETLTSGRKLILNAERFSTIRFETILRWKSFQCNIPLRRMVDLTKFEQHRCEFLNSNQKRATCCLFSGYAENRSQWHVTLHGFLWATSYRDKSWEKIVQCDTIFIQLSPAFKKLTALQQSLSLLFWPYYPIVFTIALFRKSDLSFLERGF